MNGAKPVARSGPFGRGRAWLLIALAALLAMVPAIWFDQLTRGDARFHLRWQNGFAGLFWQGDLAPRWLPMLNEGFGSPAFFIYPPMTQWVASLFTPVLPGAEHVATRLALGLFLALLLSGIGALQWLESLTRDRRAAIFGAMLYMLLPYHLYVDTYHRAAMGELWAFAFAPWGLYGVEAIAKRDGREIPILALAIAGIFLSHAPSALMIVPVILLYAATLAWQRGRVAYLARTIILTGMSVGVAGFYLATALTQTRFINAAALFGGRSEPARWLLGGPTWPDTSMMPVIAVLLLCNVAAAAFCALLAWRADTVPERRWITILLAVIVLVSTLLQTYIAHALWAMSTPLSRIQFPWRLLTVQTLAVAGLGAVALRAALATRQRVLCGLLLAAVPAALLLDGALFGYRILRERQLTPPSTAAVLLLQTADAPEYQLGDVIGLARRFGAAQALLTRSGTIAVTAWEPRNVTFRVTSTAPARILVRQFAYTGWKYRVDGGDWRPADRVGSIVALPVPTGRHAVEAKLSATSAERIGGVGSLLSLAMVLAWWRFARRPASR